ncbi:MAG: radical SAM protein [Nanoarchaeota archaeon]
MINLCETIIEFSEKVSPKSKYTFSKYLNVIPYKSNVILLSGRTGRIIVCTNNEWKLVKKYLRSPNNNEDFFYPFIETGMIVNKEFDEFAYLLNKTNENRKELIERTYDGSRSGGIWLTLGNSCNLKCIYCYLEKNTSLMSFETINDALEQFHDGFVKGKLKNAQIAIAGGEPLLYKDRVKHIFIKSKMLFKEDFNKVIFFIITNGTLIDDDLLKFIKTNKINVLFQISIDGNEDIHNKRRMYADGKGTYNTIIKNLKRVAEYGNLIIIRIHADESNYSKMDKFFHDIKPILNSKVTVDFIAPVCVDKDVKYDSKQSFIKFDKMVESFNSFVDRNKLKLYNETETDYNPLSSTSYLGRNISFCSGFVGQKFWLDPKGNWLACPMEEWVIGDIKNGISYSKVKELNNMVKENNKCLRCPRYFFCSKRVCHRVILTGMEKHTPFINNKDFKYMAIKYAKSAGLV